MSGLNISFSRNSERINMQYWYQLAGPDGTIEKGEKEDKDLFPFEREVHRRILMADIDSKKGLSQIKKFNSPFSYTYSRYLELRETLAKDTVSSKEKDMAKLKFDTGSSIKFYNNGNLMSALLDGDQVYQGLKLRSGSSIMLHAEGQIVFATLAEDQRIKVGTSVITGKAGSEISFYSNGRLKQITTAKSFTMRWTDTKGRNRSTTCSPDTIITYYDSGEPKSFFSEEYKGPIYLKENGDFDVYSTSGSAD